MIQLYVYIYMRKYTSHTLFSKGLILVMCERWVGDGTDVNILTPSSSDDSSTSSSFCWAAQPGSWGPKPSVWSWFELQLELQLTQAVRGTWLYNCLRSILLPIGVCIEFNHVHRSRWYPDIFDRMHLLFTQLHLLIDSSVKGQYVTTVCKQMSSNSLRNSYRPTNCLQIIYM